MTIRQVATGVAAFGAITAALLLVGLNSIGGVFAFFQLGLFVGAPLAFVLHHELRSWPVAGVMAAALSIALSAISAQFLVWFEVASGVLVVLTATTYGVVLAWLLSATDYGRAESRRH